jgi:hypothetical protein
MNTSTCVEKIRCKDCGSSDSIQTYLNVDDSLGIEWHTSFCHGECWENKGDPYTKTPAPVVVPKTEAELKEELSVVVSCKMFIPKESYRGIPAKFFARWGCRLLISEYDGKTPYAIGFAYSDNGKLTGWKCRPFHKKDFFAIGRTSSVDPFGWTRAVKMGGDTLWVVEGEYDAIALDYCMVLAGDKVGYPVVSLTQGGGSIEKNFKHIEGRIGRYKHIVLVLDNDKVGLLAEQTALAMWPNKILLVRKPNGSKDANDAVKAGHALEMGMLALNFKK